MDRIDILKDRQVMWVAVKINKDTNLIAEGKNSVLRKVVDGFLPIKDDKGNPIEHYIVINKKMNQVGLFETVNKSITKKVEVPIFWKLMVWFGKEIYLTQDFKSSRGS